MFSTQHRVIHIIIKVKYFVILLCIIMLDTGNN